MSVFSKFINKCVSVLKHGIAWCIKLLKSLIEAGRTISYVETVNPSQVDTLHKQLKWNDLRVLKKAFEEQVRKVLPKLRLGRVKVAVDVTEEPYWGKELFNTRPGVHTRSEGSWQFVNLSIVEPKFIPLMSLPYRQVDDLDELVFELLNYLKTLPLKVSLVLFDRGFYHSKLIDFLEGKNRGWSRPYLIFVPKNKAMLKYIDETKKLGCFRHKMNYSLKKSKWKPTTNIVVCKGVGYNRCGKPLNWVFATNQKPSVSLVKTYRKRWNIETGFRIHDEAKIKSKSNNLIIRFFYHLVSMLLILTWRVHNQIFQQTVFKRYLKQVEQTIHVVTKPPDKTFT